MNVHKHVSLTVLHEFHGLVLAEDKGITNVPSIGCILRKKKTMAKFTHLMKVKALLWKDN